VIITIDGPAGTGKSTVAHRLAERLGLEFLDTGAMYRVAALVAIEQGIDPDDGVALAAALAADGPTFDWTADPPTVLLGTRDVSRRIREQDVGDLVSIVAAQPQLREVLVRQQQRIAEEHPRLVSEGRDQGSVVFPDAGLRVYLDAAVEVRAERRLGQLIAAGMPADRDRIVSDIRQRDQRDSSRIDGPLVCPPGAIVVDTSNLTLEQVVDELDRICRKHFPAARLKA
jgi:cytidylate kinase